VKTCTSCCRRLPLARFQSAGNGKHKPTCLTCIKDQRRLRSPLAPIREDPVQVHINNAVHLWHGPVTRTALKPAV